MIDNSGSWQAVNMTEMERDREGEAFALFEYGVGIRRRVDRTGRTSNGSG